MKRDLLPEAAPRFEALSSFTEHMLLSQDIDPLYPMLREVEADMDREEALWFTFLYVAWYNIASALAAYMSAPPPNQAVILHTLSDKWPTGTERRANRGGKVREHINSYLNELEVHTCAQCVDEHCLFSQRCWYRQDFPYQKRPWTRAQKHTNWVVLNARLQTLYLNGRWAAYKHCEVLAKVNDFPVLAPDMGHAFSSGPREGLEMLYGPLSGNTTDVINELDARGLDLVKRLRAEGHPVDVEEVETILCNWKSLMKGKYYVGHDIDENQEQILVAEERGILAPELSAILWAAREASLPHEYLGELGGWEGVDKERMRVYRDTGIIVVRTEEGDREVA